jgi:LmbE family N-acetylglucosaminyl deacetylase
MSKPQSSHDRNASLMLWAALVVGISVTSSCTFAAGSSRSSGNVVTTSSARIRAVDVLVFAPHPDDEVIGAGGVLQQAIEAGKHVLVVFATNGDGYALAASNLVRKGISALTSDDYLKLAAARQREAVAAERVLGISASDLVFLGYPDGVLAEVDADIQGSPIQSPTTGRTATYGPIYSDYHTLAFGRPATYTRAFALRDIEDVLRESQPKELYVTDLADQHPDHRATYDLVRDAIAAIGLRATVRTYVVHGGPGWPRPMGPTPAARFESQTVGGVEYPIGVRWPPYVRVPLTRAESMLKLEALQAFQTQMGSPIDRLFLDSFVKSEEVFWTL